MDFQLSQEALRARARALADDVFRARAARWDASEEYPRDNVADLVVTSEALQIHGAAGYGRELPLERMARDARMFAIGGGTVEMMRNLIADRILPARADFRR